MTKKTLKEIKAVFDQKVYNWILKNPPNTCAGDIERNVVVPEQILDSMKLTGAEYKIMRAVDGSLQRMKRAGRIWCCKSGKGRPHWEVCEGQDV